jgi:hypothetical protein
VNIGDWVRRQGGKWHLVESTVAGDAITKCGRRMKLSLSDFESDDLQVNAVEPLTRMIGQPQNCKLCSKETT